MGRLDQITTTIQPEIVERTVKNKPSEYDNTPRYLLVDSDSILYTANYGTENDIEECKFKVSNKIQEITINVEQHFNIQGTILFVGSSESFRREIYPEYKANRPPKHPNIDILRDYMIEKHNAILCTKGEADDYVYTAYLNAKDNCVCVFIDKDLRSFIHSCPIYDYRSYKDTLGEFKYVTEEESRYNFAQQIMIGDSSDGINFTPGIGDKYAKSVLKIGSSDYSYLRVIYEAYLKAWKNDKKLAKKKMILAYHLLKLYKIS